MAVNRSLAEPTATVTEETNDLEHLGSIALRALQPIPEETRSRVLRGVKLFEDKGYVFPGKRWRFRF